MPTPKQLLTTIIAVLAVGVVAAPAAPAATTIGNACVGNTSEEGVTLTQLAQTSSTLPLTAPQAGVITKWGTAVIPYPGGLNTKLKVLRPTGGPNTFQVVGESASEAVVSGVNSYSTRVPIQAGDRIGASGGASGITVAIFCESGAPGDVMGKAVGDQGINSTSAYAEVPTGSVPLTATIEPDADGDGFGDETQDKCPQSAAQQAACPVLVLDAVKLFAGKGSVRILVASDNQASITVSASAKVPKANGKGTTLTKLSPIVQLVTPGKIATYTLNFNKALKNALKALPRKKSISLAVVATGSATGGAITSDKLNVKLKGQAKPPKKAKP